MILTKIKFMIGTAIILCAGFLLIPVKAEEQTAVDSLWQQAVNIATQNQDIVPGTIYLHSNEFNSKGILKKEEKTWTKVFLDQDGNIRMDLVKYLENGIDVTETKKKEFEQKEKNKEKKKKNEMGMDLGDFNPFNPDIQKDITISSLNLQESVNSQSCSVYKYTRAMPNGVTQTGKAWLDSSTGIPLQIEYTLDPLPAFVKELTFKINYKKNQNNIWAPYKVNMAGKVNAFFYKATISSQFLMEAYWRHKKLESI